MPEEPKRPLKVFLCHAHADRDPVRALYARLTQDGVDAWLDKEKLLPGQDWELEIRKAVREADVVVVCLSKQFNQAGFRQKEVRLALDTAMEQPEGEIFIIPARLEECDSLESLRKWHWVDLFEEDGYKVLTNALKSRGEKVGATLQVKRSGKTKSNALPKREKTSSNAPVSSGGVSIGGGVSGSVIVNGNRNVINLTQTTHSQVESLPKISSIRSVHRLPPMPADFTGREAEINELLANFEDHSGAVISGLTGLGGIGKTSLGLVVAHQLIVKYPDAQIFRDLKGTTSPVSVKDLMTSIIYDFDTEVSLPDLHDLSEDELKGRYLSQFHGKRVLLFLDNARSANQIAPLRLSDSSAMLVTSRWTFGMPGLKNQRMDVLSEKTAEEFLLTLCPRIDQKAPELAQACAYLPLALRITGSFLSVNENWPVELYLAQLNDRKQTLAALQTAHQQAELTSEPDLFSAFELSYQQLTEDDKRRWRMLGVFSSLFDINIAAYVWDLKEEPTRKLLGLLYRYSLLDYADKVHDRYRLHDLLASFALQHMEDGEEKDVRQRYFKYYLNIIRINLDLDDWDSDMIDGMLFSFEGILGNRIFEDIPGFLGLISQAYSHLYIARGYATPDIPREIDYYMNMISVRKILMQVLRLKDKLK